MSYFTKYHWSRKCFVGNPKPQLPRNIGQETKVLYCMLLGKHFTKTFFFNFWQTNYFLPQNARIVKLFIFPSVSLIWHMKCGWEIYSCPQSKMMDWWTDRHTWFDFDFIYSFFIQGNHFSAKHWSPSGPCQTDIQTYAHIMTIPLGQGVKIHSKILKKIICAGQRLMYQRMERK